MVNQLVNNSFPLSTATLFYFFIFLFTGCGDSAKEEQSDVTSLIITEPSIANKLTLEENSFEYQEEGEITGFDPMGSVGIKANFPGIGSGEIYQYTVNGNEDEYVYVVPDRTVTLFTSDQLTDLINSIGGSEIFTKTGGDNKPPIQTKSMGFGDRLRARMSKASPQSVDSLRLPAVHRYE